MSNYVESALMRGESVVYRGRVSLWSVCFYLLIGGIFILAGVAELIRGGGLLTLVVGLALIAPAAIRYFCTEIAITDKRLIAKTGLISRQTIELNLPKVESVQVSQGIFGRMLNFGNLTISGAGNPQAPVRGIAAPMEFRRQFFQLTDDKEQAAERRLESRAA